MDPLISGLIAGLTSGTVIAAILGTLLVRRTKRVKKEVEAQFLRLQAEFQSQRVWKEKAVAELLGPVCMQLNRTRRAFGRWREKNLFLEVKVIREGNIAIRDMLLKTPHLVPPELFEAAAQLIEHYDRWLEEYERVRQAEQPDLDTRFIFVGPAGYPFPSEAEEQIQRVYRQYWEELYGASYASQMPNQ